jgi:hypothetical protein
MPCRRRRAPREIVVWTLFLFVEDKTDRRRHFRAGGPRMISIERDTTSWDSADYLKSGDDQIAYLAAVLEEDNPELLTHALTVIARVDGGGRAISAPIRK